MSESPNGARPGVRPGAPRGGNRPINAATIFVQEYLEDGEWHDYDKLVADLAATDIQLQRYEAKNYARSDPRASAARAHVLEVVRRPTYQVEKKPGSTKHNGRVRRKPGHAKGSKVRVCVRCGKSNLVVKERVRRTVTMKIPARWLRTETGTVTKSTGDTTVATVVSEFLCITCADHELNTKGVEWRYEVLPPWLVEQLPAASQQKAGLVSSTSPSGVSEEAGNGK